MIFEGCPGGARVEGIRPGRLKGLFLGSGEPVTDQQLLICQKVKADTRLTNCQLEIGRWKRLEMHGKLDCQLVI